MTFRQEQAIAKAVKFYEKIEKAKRDAELFVAVAVDKGVPVARLAREMGLSRQRIYQMRDAGRLYLDG